MFEFANFASKNKLSLKRRNSPRIMSSSSYAVLVVRRISQQAVVAVTAIHTLGNRMNWLDSRYGRHRRRHNTAGKAQYCDLYLNNETLIGISYTMLRAFHTIYDIEIKFYHKISKTIGVLFKSLINFISEQKWNEISSGVLTFDKNCKVWNRN